MLCQILSFLDAAAFNDKSTQTIVTAVHDAINAHTAADVLDACAAALVHLADAPAAKSKVVCFDFCFSLFLVLFVTQC